MESPVTHLAPAIDGSHPSLGCLVLGLVLIIFLSLDFKDECGIRFDLHQEIRQVVCAMA